MKIGMLTGGGDCPGLNAVIRAAGRYAHQKNWEVVGFKNGWKGLVDNVMVPLTPEAITGILHRGGTILGTSRTNPYKKEGDVEKVKNTFKVHGLDALIVIGGEDTLGVASKLAEEGLPIVGVPKTIDNDLSCTDFTFGFDTAVNIAMECIDRLHTTAESHNRVMVVEIMGRHAGWITAHAGLAGGADVVLIPEVLVDIDEVCDIIKKRHARGRTFSIVAVSEGVKFKGYDVTQKEQLDAFGHVRLGGIGQVLADKIEERTQFETRVTVLGHIQRGGSPTAFDRVLGTRFGYHAIELIEQKKFGFMVSLYGNAIIPAPLKDATSGLKLVPEDFYKMVKTYFG
ncbi:MAG: pyrophosphate--fructose-6-phosphate 1-phosphotransferase [Omnitrophica bacterium RIFCSPLOWO2_12_FULL_44_17]|uniref:Pyrophosphate--fructose 6-phosphate 1-phosphotransferase n=1 Tax=Candidatus Danuiimicrobium aquiferis TaxID=1801832 RepID=A0A1G1L2Q5_9BACT|nr:MAG: pyrophosphate--fructose-6-phosphate 1-phosphotransferase [Omnitrophica bacterium RIFCSPHIGHO2_02_FULL_45_28]OGW89777.1 MAG: pyrophosphate--fructose-6-phosphate 1-phosphotransferase [Omnitrophica bacterium RIFCSPHIGHO2_12_FULL_44_12]OGW99420.1 MAG: pyrophosphate--fructose-6-phosphate 1-phosphotransferase [Omnitrophica bacterium RIFCSPLOWO2_12_FULL_44_17]OGX03032.1 MAG: pyrophosphate--fructose-6-phosphate 1-phosphotransferase [Omnitrophica bacterium RIFCSPLOWO2_02_FULL_44_11]